ncbi:MAG TPA: CGNR zinc finger domain-containing protein [Microlunatus sp.]|jgi:predicted RNA-binding Zn ribbon-like protein|nr:CGNR zinc finger domain-containing protein [Microlunatus sp.]
MSDGEEIPPGVRLVRDFVNTYEPQVDEESLQTSDALRDWLIDRRLVPAASAVTDADLAATLVVREGLRNVLLSHAGHAPDPEVMDAFRAVLADLPVRLDFSPFDYRLVSTRTDPVGQALGQLLDAVRQTSLDGTWPRLKVCARDTCRWAFYDASRNQVRRWCSMAGCGNYIKMRRAAATRKARGGSATAAGQPRESP